MAVNKDFQTKRHSFWGGRRKGSKQNAPLFKEPKPFWRRWLLRFFFVFILVAALAGGTGYVVFTTVTSSYKKWAAEFNLEDINNLDHPGIIYDRNGEEIGRIFDENRSYVTLDQISPSMIDALVAQEDKSFWTHPGYDVVGIARAVKATATAQGEVSQGASTITQQLARGAYDLERRTKARGGSKYERKIVEIFLAMRIEEKYDKKQIIEFYLNRIYFGRGFYGIRAASLGYYGKEPVDLTVRESASLAALIKNPENYNPIRRPELNLKWRNDVIDRMQRSNYLTADEASRIKEMPLGLNPKPLERNTSYLYEMVKAQTLELFRSDRAEEIVKSAGIRVYTTIDKQMQEAAENTLQDQLKEIESQKDYKHVTLKDRLDPRVLQHKYLDAAVYAIDNKTGGIMVYVGGRDFTLSNYDVIASGQRPPGTALLPFLYACAFDNGLSPCNRYIDDAMDNRLVGIGGSEGILGEWGMELNKGSYLDSVTLRQALSWSKIAASARLGMQLGAKRFISELKLMGLTPPPRNPDSTEVNPTYYPRVYLGTEPQSLRELVLAYTSFPNLGSRPITAYVITKVTDSAGNILWENPLDKQHKQVKTTEPCTAFRVHSILREGLEKGAAMRVSPYLPSNFNGAIKTGTNYTFADNTLMGYGSSFTCGVWMGFLNDSSAIYPTAFSSDTCGPILGAVFHAAADRYDDKKLLPPDDTEEVEICCSSGQQATDFCFEPVLIDGKPSYERRTYLEYFRKGDVNLERCGIHGDGVPSLGDFVGSSVGAARVLAIEPILPKSPILVGDDPYGCELSLSPRHKDGAGLSESDSKLAQPLDNLKSDADAKADLLRSSEAQLDSPKPKLIQLPPIPLNL